MKKLQNLTTKELVEELEKRDIITKRNKNYHLRTIKLQQELEKEKNGDETKIVPVDNLIQKLSSICQFTVSEITQKVDRLTLEELIIANNVFTQPYSVCFEIDNRTTLLTNLNNICDIFGLNYINFDFRLMSPESVLFDTHDENIFPSWVKHSNNDPIIITFENIDKVSRKNINFLEEILIERKISNIDGGVTKFENHVFFASIIKKGDKIKSAEFNMKLHFASV